MIVRLACCVFVLCAAAVARAGESAPYRPLSHRNDLWCGSTYWTGPDWTPVDATPAALRRGPSAIDAGALGGRPFSYVEVVQPVLDKHCLRCHGGEKIEANVDLSGKPEGGFTRSYLSLCRDKKLVPRFEMRNQIQVTRPGGTFGARGSRLMSLLRGGHEGVELSAAELGRLGAWIDLNAIFYGVYSPEAQARQLQGKTLPMPEIQ